MGNAKSPAHYETREQENGSDGDEQGGQATPEPALSGVLGSKLGFSIQLNDNDGKGRVAQMNWGGGLFPNWFPRNFGVVTFVQ